MKPRRRDLLLHVCAAWLIVSMLLGLLPQSALGKSAEAQWTVLIYYAADNNLEAIMMRDLNRLEAIGSTDEVNFVALVDRHPQYWTGSDNWSDTRLFRLEKDANLFYIASPVLMNLHEVNTGSPDTLQRFIEWGVKSYPAQQYALVIADHGGGWQGAAADESSDDQMIGLAGLVDALDGGVRNAGLEKLDLLIFDACLMAQMEVWSLLSPYARYGVASEEITYGLNGFTNAMQDLVNDPTTSASDLATALVNYYADYYAKDEARTTLTMSAADLERVPDVQRGVEKLADQLIEDIDTPATILATARGLAHSPTFADTDRAFFGMIDLRSFLLIVQKLSKNPKVVEAAQEVQQALQVAVIAKYGGSDVSSVGGLSFFFPTYPKMVDIYTNGYEDVLPPVPGAKESHWVKFLGLYPEAVKKDVEKPTVSAVKLKQDTLTAGERLEAEANVGGVGLKEVDLIVGRVEGDALITVDSNRLVLNEEQIEEGLSIPVWDDKKNGMTASWDGAGWVLSNGQQTVRTSIQASAPGSNVFAVPGYILSVAGGNEMEGEIQFTVDIEAGESTFLGAFARQKSGLLGPYTFETGDAFVVKRQLINLEDGSAEDVKGGMLIIGQSPPQLLPSPVPGGVYEFGIRAVNLADDGTTQLAQVHVERESAPVEYRSQSLSLVTQRPGDWLVQETVGTVTFTPDELSSVKAQIGAIPLSRLGVTGRQSLDKILPSLLDTLSADETVSKVKPGLISDATLADQDARQMAYTYELRGRGQIAGSLVAFVDETREQLYVSISEAPAKTMQEERASLDLVRENMHLLPTMFVNRVYTNQTMGFSLSYNNYWQVIERPASSEVFFHTPALDAAFRVQERPGKRQPTAADNDVLLAIYTDEALKGQDNLELGDPQNMEISTLWGRRFEYSFTNADGKDIKGVVVAVTTRDGRAYVLNGEVDASSPEMDTLGRDVEHMLLSFTIVEPQASPVPNPGEGWKIYENQDLHFGVAYLDFMNVEEDLSDPDFQVVRFIYQELVGVEIAVVPLTKGTPPTTATADKLVKGFVDKLRGDRPNMQTGTLANMDLAGIPARGMSYGWIIEDAPGADGPVEMEAGVLAAPTPYGFAYLVNVFMPTFFTGDLPVDANIMPNVLGTFTPLLEGLEPVSQVGTSGQQLKFYLNARLGLSVMVPKVWKVQEESDKVTFAGTDQIGRAVPNYHLSFQDEGKQDMMSAGELDERLGATIADIQESEDQPLRPMGNIGDPAEKVVGGVAGRSVEFLALVQGTDLVNYTATLVQTEAGRLYLVTLAVPVTVVDQQEETISQVLESVQFQAK